MYMANNKTQLSEGVLVNLVDNFFKSLQRGAADRYIKAAEKAEIHPDVIKVMNSVADNQKLLNDLVKKYHLK